MQFLYNEANFLVRSNLPRLPLLLSLGTFFVFDLFIVDLFIVGFYFPNQKQPDTSDDRNE